MKTRNHSCNFHSQGRAPTIFPQSPDGCSNTAEAATVVATATATTAAAAVNNTPVSRALVDVVKTRIRCAPKPLYVVAHTPPPRKRQKKKCSSTVTPRKGIPNPPIARSGSSYVSHVECIATFNTLYDMIMKEKRRRERLIARLHKQLDKIEEQNPEIFGV